MRSWLQRRRINRRLSTILAWADHADPHALERQTAGWAPADWRLARQIIFVHGLGPYLHHSLFPAGGPAIDALQPLRSFLETQHLGNQRRIERIHEDLAAILREARRRAVAILPLKGILVGLFHLPHPSLRPMADLDLLVRPEQGAALGEALADLGYQQLPPDNRYAQDRHLRYLKPDNRRVVSWTEEHPDNPRPVEVHTHLRRQLWGDLRIPDQAPWLWSDSVETKILGEPILCPRPERLLAYLAVHTLDHMMVSTARGLQFVDLAVISDSLQRLAPIQNPDWLYLPLRLTHRLLPRTTSPRFLDELAGQVDPYLRRWVETVPMDGRCGLLADPALPGSTRWWVHWERWAPTPWRLRLAASGAVWPRAVAGYVGVLIRHMLTRQPIDTG